MICSGWVGLKKSKTWWRNTWMVPKADETSSICSKKLMAMATGVAGRGRFDWRRSVNPISTRGTDYAYHVTTCSPTPKFWMRYLNFHNLFQNPPMIVFKSSNEPSHFSTYLFLFTELLNDPIFWHISWSNLLFWTEFLRRILMLSLQSFNLPSLISMFFIQWK